MYKITIIALILVALFETTFAQPPKKLEVKGTFINKGNFNKIKLQSFTFGYPTVDSSVIDQNGKFKLLAYIKDTNFYRLYLDERNYLVVVGIPGESMEITSDLKDVSRKTSVKGSEQTEFIYRNLKISRTYELQMDSLNRLYQTHANPLTLDSIRIVLAKKYQEIEKEYKDFVIKLLSANKNYLGTLFFVDKIKPDEAPEVLMSLDSSLRKLYPKNMLVEELHHKVYKMLSLSIGGFAPEIELPDTNNQNVKLSSLRGKYVLIDFWASWCSPCMKELPTLKKAYELYKNKTFEIYGVSLDRDRNSWLAAIRRNSMKWVHVSDLKYWQSSVVSQYNIDGIPFTVLINPEGKIIAKNLRGEALLEKLDSIFGQ